VDKVIAKIVRLTFLAHPVYGGHNKFPLYVSFEWLYITIVPPTAYSKNNNLLLWRNISHQSSMYETAYNQTEWTR